MNGRRRPRKPRPKNPWKFDARLKFALSPRRDAIVAAKAAERRHIQQVRTAVFTRDRACRVCQGRRACFLPDQMHELHSRAQTRGRPVAERFSTANCIRLCAYCHQDVTEHRLVLHYDAAGADGVVRGEVMNKTVQKPVDPKQGKGGKTVVKVVGLVISDTYELEGVKKALRYALNDGAFLVPEYEREAAEHVLDRITAR